MSTQRKEIIEAILTNSALSAERKSEVIAQMLDEFDKNYPDLKYHATKNDVTETELKLTKEIENTRKEIKELDVKLTKEIENTRKEIKELDVRLTKEIKEVELKLTKEIENTRKEIKELDVRLTKEIKELELKLTKEIENTRKEIKDVDAKLSKEIQLSKAETIKWTAGIVFAQFIALSGLILTTFKLFSH